jgi:hypothetical protein
MNSRVGGYFSAAAQFIHKLGRRAQFDATMGQCQDNFIVGTMVGHQPGGEVNIGLQNVACHGYGEFLYRQTSPDTSQQL